MCCLMFAVYIVYFNHVWSWLLWKSIVIWRFSGWSHRFSLRPSAFVTKDFKELLLWQDSLWANESFLIGGKWLMQTSLPKCLWYPFGTWAIYFCNWVCPRRISEKSDGSRVYSWECSTRTCHMSIFPYVQYVSRIFPPSEMMPGPPGISEKLLVNQSPSLHWRIRDISMTLFARRLVLDDFRRWELNNESFLEVILNHREKWRAGGGLNNQTQVGVCWPNVPF